MRSDSRCAGRPSCGWLHPSHMAVGQEAPGLRLEHHNTLRTLHVGFIFATLVGCELAPGALVGTFLKTRLDCRVHLEPPGAGRPLASGSARPGQAVDSTLTAHPHLTLLACSLLILPEGQDYSWASTTPPRAAFVNGR
jgi:hypothetical protein